MRNIMGGIMKQRVDSTGRFIPTKEQLPPPPQTVTEAIEDQDKPCPHDFDAIRMLSTGNIIFCDDCGETWLSTKALVKR